MRRDKLIEACIAGLGGLVIGCAGEGGREGSQGSGIESLDGSASNSGPTSGGSATSGTGSADGTGSATSGSNDDDPPDTVFDLGTQPDVNLEPETGCTKVDFLFVIDNSGSMGDNQADLANNFPNFINGIQATLQEVNEYQVGVITTDAYQYNVAGCNQLGGLVVKTGGTESSNMMCGPYANGKNFMTEADDLASKFACAAKVGSGGNGLEKPMNAMEIAVRKDLGGVGQCNEGYIRDDALLVIVIITDEWDGPGDPELLGSSGNAATWYDTVVTAKGGIPENIVVLSLVHFAGCPPTDGFLSGDIEVFTNMFGQNGFLGCISSDYGAIFSDATSIIDEACSNFMPPG